MKKLSLPGVGHLAAALLSGSIIVAISASPSWWAETGRPFLAPGKAAQDNAVVVQGQLRYALDRVVKELDAKYAEVGGAGNLLRDAAGNIPNARIASPAAALFADSRQYNVLKIGQLKFISRLVFDRLDALGISYDSLKQNSTYLYPWNPSAAGSSDSSPAVAGQLKYLFSFNTRPDLNGDGILDPLSDAAKSRDRDGDGMSDQWESTYGLDFRKAASANEDTDGDGTPDRLDLDPAHTGGALTIEILTPNGNVF